MILGILSDTHGAQATTARAVEILRQAGAAAFVHCGDVGRADVLDELAGTPAWVVLGNTDEGDADLLRYGTELGLTMARAGPLRIELAGRVLAVFHGHERTFGRLLRSLADEGVVPADLGRCDYLLHGHTHTPRDVRVGRAGRDGARPLRIINPGALHRAAEHTVATLDLQTDHVRFWRVPEVG
jgi:putative phosphoesterase